MSRFVVAIICIAGAVWFWYGESLHTIFLSPERVWVPQGYAKAVRVTLDDDGRVFEVSTRARTIRDFLQEQNIRMQSEDSLLGAQEDVVYEGKKIIVRRAKHITLTLSGKKQNITTYQTDVERMLLESNIDRGENDLVLPKGEGVVAEGMAFSMIRVNIEERIIDKPIAFATDTQEDDALSFRKSIVTQQGENGTKRLTYKVLSYDGIEIDRKMIKQDVVKDPVTQEVMQGTYVAVGKAHTGLGTWYAYTGTLSAASPWLPMGSYVKVTNQQNGKTVIVKINDRGPFGKNRILDLDKVAFAKIASVGAGIIPLKVEEITN